MNKLEGLYACECSRKDIISAGDNQNNGIYSGTCRLKKLKYDARQHVLRMHITADALAKSHGDFVLWRKGDQPSYQLVSLIGDVDMGTNLLVRGEDLIASSIMQKYLAKQLKLPNFMQAKFVHHKMMATRNGEKLSKSNENLSLRFMAENGALPRDIYKEVALALNLAEANHIENATDFYHSYSMRDIQ